ncbi:neutral/alkaline non-lysosomal ceramidase N-terminal domain-containing protein [uncultured Cohaesibacter sp.]|uniref:neutral/alkaline non-lysosomal ceramidase N-terminal domain-containing protein n=1 Tax=uncultured Cohaesibacter sp. TaxID=1002546 RepID=UPI0029C7B5BE|nr:neutral/alkaline non-lysosomal ceramidase N-terminal domain-containing protein [uncultured Cohaesibacter sp.]
MQTRRDFILTMAGLGFVSAVGVPSSAFAATTASTSPKEGLLRAGAARVEIKVSDNFFPYDSFNHRHFTGSHDALYIRSILVDNGTSSALFISVDTGDISGEWLEEISTASGVPLSNIFLTATHTHESGYISRTLAENLSEPEKSATFKAIAKDALFASIEAAKSNMQDCQICYDTGTADVNVNRNETKPNAPHNPDGVSDKTVSVLTFKDMADTPFAYAYSYAVHSTVMLFSDVKDGGMMFSGDLAGAASRYVEKQMDDTAVAVWLLAPCADQGPKASATSRSTDADGNEIREDLGEKGFELVDSQGQEIGAEVLRVGKVSKPMEGTPEIKGTVGSVTVEGTNNQIDLRLNELRIGDVVYFGFPGELVTSVGHALQSIFAEFSWDKSVVITQANGSNGYFSDDFGYDNKTFDGTASFAKKGYDKLVLKKAKTMAADLK